jgi:undecaprenyl diphosphate synthase
MIEAIDKENVPRHIAVIMDGNGRWAQKKGAMRIFGHKNALTAVRDAIEGASDMGVEYLTLYAFSTENWSRPQDEVNALMELLVNTISSEVPSMVKNNIKLTAIGDIESLPAKCQVNLENAKKDTSKNNGLTVVLALSYSGKWEIEQAVKKIVKKIAKKELKESDITQQLIADHLTTKDIPDPELLIRTSGELRTSNFLIWQTAYTELYFTEVLWPDFRKEHLFEAVMDDQKRERRFGKTGAQVKT